MTTRRDADTQVDEQLSVLRQEIHALRRTRRVSHLTIAVMALAAALATGAGVGVAQEPQQSAEIEALRKRLDDLQREIRSIGELWDKPVSLRAPFEIRGDRGPLLRVSGGGPDGGQLEIMDGKGRPVIALGGEADRKGIFVQLVEGGMGTALFASDDDTGLAVSWDSDSPAILVGIDDEDKQVRAEIYNSEGVPVAWLASGGQRGGNLGVASGAGKLAVELKGDDKGGVLKVFSPDEKAVGGLLSEASGGQLLLTGADGGKSLVRLTAADSGGQLQLFNAAGQERAALAAFDAGGAMRLFGGSGTALVEAEATAGGRGLVEVFPKGKSPLAPQAMVGGGQ